MKRFLLYTLLTCSLLAAPKAWAQTETPTITPTRTPTDTPTSTATRTPTSTPSLTPTTTPTYTPSPFPHNETIFGAYPFFKFTIDPAECGATTECVERIQLVGLEPGDFIYVFKPSSYNLGEFIVDAQINVNNWLDLHTYNSTGGAIDEGATTYYGFWMDRTNKDQKPLAVYTFRPSPTP